ncbi:MAG: trypsin-like peptidase domain-containing protein [Rhodobacteraceae bacterium]|nr:trypsin-like peptidase domain-containing protein [Paracoccaceae bacterium]
MRFGILLWLFAIGVALPLVAGDRVPQSRAEMTFSFVPLVRAAAPAVVNIYAQRRVETRGRSPFADDPFFGNFFQNFGAQRPQIENSLGSGVLVSSDGLIVSNYHVVAQATTIRVVLQDRREYQAQVLLSDEIADLAVLQLLAAPDLPFLTLRESETVEVGELALAIGNPFGVGQTVSSGIISGLARSGAAIGNQRGYFIQTDAPINPGNSGGALVDMQGRLIGINTSILTRSGGSNGIGFAIPASLVEQFVAQARAGASSFQRPWAGLKAQTLTSDISDTLGLRPYEGILLTELHPQSPFRAAGFQIGDIVKDVNGAAVTTPEEMLYRLSVTGLGAFAEITRLRDGRASVIAVELSAAPNIPPAIETVLSRNSVLSGLKVSTLNPAIQERYKLSWTSVGFVILDTGPLGARIGLRVGDVILAVNGEALEQLQDIDRRLRAANGRGKIVVLRGARRLALRFRL